VSLIDRIPTRRPRPARKHRATDEVERLRGLLDGANILIRGMQLQVDDRDASLAAAHARQNELEGLADKLQAEAIELTEERDHLDEALAALRRRFAVELAADANATAITVPLMVRDTSAIEDQATGPIDVRTLWDALGTTDQTDPDDEPNPPYDLPEGDWRDIAPDRDEQADGEAT
jgi:hypothetical protein